MKTILPIFLSLLSLSFGELQLEGYSPVAYFTEGKAVKGSENISSEYKGHTYYFAIEESKELFDKNPTQYLPAYGGYCAYGVAKGKKVGVDPKKFTVVGGKLYLNYNGWIKRKFDKDPGKYITTANENWPEVAKQ